jgi:hypothetical protein
MKHICPNCKQIVRKNIKMTPEIFKNTFKVGDTITSWSTKKPAIITAIGHSRFLYVCGWELEEKNIQVNCIEHTASMYLNWRLLND